MIKCVRFIQWACQHNLRLDCSASNYLYELRFKWIEDYGEYDNKKLNTLIYLDPSLLDREGYIGYMGNKLLASIEDISPTLKRYLDSVR